MPKILLTLIAIGAASAAAMLALPSSSAAEDELAPWQQARVTGAAQSCISLSQIRNTRIRDDRTIDFVMRGRQTYRNTLPQRCGSLGRNDAFAYETSLSRLCSTDIITVLPQPIRSGLPGPRCGLGQFVPIEMPAS